MDLYSFIITSFIIILLPGTGVIYTMQSGLTGGRKKSVIAAIGCTLGIVPHLVISISLLTLFFSLNERIVHVVTFIGAVYLLYLGIGIIINNIKINLDEKNEEKKKSKIIKRGIMINVLNPKLTLFFFSFLPQYVQGSEDNYVIKSVVLGLLFMLFTFIVFCGYGYLAGMVRDYIVKSSKALKVIQVLFGLLFIVFSIKMII
ncbi:MAG TPA: LysE family translocator [Lachnospiraceae bacterium]|nr:LysE family translocator [uncultured Lachnoclostridium sp.]HAU84025.1 LysE family translocator [Lachnospiraceae bacterium]